MKGEYPTENSASDPFISIIVSTLNDEVMIKGCLFSLLQTTYPPDRREIIIVDNGSTDRTAKTVKGFPVHYLYEKKRGVPFARNRGIEFSNGEILVFTDPDCVVSKGWLDNLVRSFDSDAVGGVAGAIVPYPGLTPAELYSARIRSHSQERPMSHPFRPFAMTPNIAFRREVFNKIGLVDSRFPGHGWEDADLCWRFSKGTNLELKYAPRAVVFHRYRTTARDFFLQHLRYGHGLALLFEKYNDELSWGWRESLRANKTLARGTGKFVKSGLQASIRNSDEVQFYTAYFGFLRLFGQRVGFICGSHLGRWIFNG